MHSKLNSIWLDWRAKVPNGVPNPSNDYHLVLLKELCLSKGIDTKTTDSVILFLEKKEKIPDDTPIKYKLKNKNTGDMEDKETTYGSAIRMKKEHPAYIVANALQSDDGDDDEKEKEPTKQMKIDANPFDKEDEEDKEGGEKNISPDNQKVVADFDGRVNDNIEFLSDDKKQLAKESLEKINTLYNEDASKEDQKEAAQWLIDNAGFSTNEMPKSGQRKAYLNNIGGDRKILGNGTKNTENLVQKIESLLGPTKIFNSKAVTQGFSTAAKPDLGDENIIKPKDDDNVSSYFKNHPILQKIRPGLHGIFGVRGEDGKVKMPSSEHSKDYLAQSINNPALQNTIDFAKKQVKEGNVDKGVLASLENHQKRMQDVLNNYDIPSEDAKKAIAASYNDLMVKLHKSDPDIASSIMKQLAENNLYEQELASGEEVYLPSAGNFPAGDKIKGGTLEKVSLISCKFGKKGRIYGCPANSKTICELHQNESKQNNQGQYLGEPGHTLVINDKLIKGETKEETKEKTKGFIKNALTEVGLGDTFSDDEMNEIANVTSEYMDEIDNINKELDGIDFPNEGARWKEFSKRVAKIEGGYKKRLGEVITIDHAAALLGENNAKNLVQKGGVKIEALLSAIEIANNIRTNEALNDLEHNKQFYDDNGEPKFVTSKGTQNPNDYSITFRTKRTAGRTGGGCQLSFTGDGAPAPVDLTDDGQTIDAKTGEVKEA